jgi:Fe-S cluster assembly ATP-binding protein
MAQLVISDLHVSIDDKEILKGVSLVINDNEIHAIMGPNGNGKSTLLSTIMGHPRFTVTKGSVTLDGEDVLEMEVDERSKAGLFLGMQYPQEVPGVTNAEFLKSAINARRDTPIGLYEFVSTLERNIETLRMKPDLAHRYLNEGFSGGEKKRNEILQLLTLNPTFAMLDEIDSGLDIDALGIVANVLKQAQDERRMGLMIVSHYERFFEFIKPTHTHIMMDGRIVLSSDETLVSKIDQEGYDWIDAEVAKEDKKERPVSLMGESIREVVGEK